MVVSLTIIPVLAARFLGRRPMPTTGPIYNLLADRYEGLLRRSACGSRRRRCSSPCSRWFRSGGWQPTWRPASCPTWTRGRSCSTTTCRSAPRWPRPTRSCAGSRRCFQRTPDIAGYIRRTGAELGFFATEPYTGDILVSLKPAGPAAADGARSSTPSARSSRPRSPSWRPSSSRWSRTRSTTWRASTSPIEVKVFGPEFAKLRELAEQVGKIVEGVRRRDRRERARLPRQSRHRRSGPTASRRRGSA